MKRRLSEERERLPAGDRRRELSAEELVDDEAGVIARTVEIAKQRAERRNVDRAVALGEDRVDLPSVRLRGDVLDLDVEEGTEPVPRFVYQFGDRFERSEPFVLVGDGFDCDLHTSLCEGFYMSSGLGSITSGFSGHLPRPSSDDSHRRSEYMTCCHLRSRRTYPSPPSAVRGATGARFKDF